MSKCPFCGQEEDGPRGVLEVQISLKVIASEYEGKVCTETEVDPEHYDEIMFETINKAKKKKLVVWHCPKCKHLMTDKDIVAFYHDGKYS